MLFWWSSTGREPSPLREEFLLKRGQAASSLKSLRINIRDCIVNYILAAIVHALFN